MSFDAILEKVLGKCGVASHFRATPHGRHHYYEVTGQGPLATIVLVHGMGASAAHFAPLMLRLRPKARRIIALDLPGHGLSEPLTGPLDYQTLFAAADETLQSLLDGPSIVYGNSLGGAFALRFALRLPHKVAALILCSPAGAVMSSADLTRFRAHFAVQSYGDALRFIASLLGHMPWYSVLMVPLVRRMASSPTVRKLLACTRPTVSREELHALSMPILLLRGKADQIMTERGLEFFRENLPQNVSIIEPDAWGHCPHLNRTKDLCDELMHFLSTQPALSGVKHQAELCPSHLAVTRMSFSRTMR